MKNLLLKIALPALALAFTACRPDQVEHLKDSKRIGIEAENWEVKRIMPKDLLHATRWAGDSLTTTADSLLRRTLARELAAGGVAGAMGFCRPEAYHAVDSLAGVLKATARRVSEHPRNPACIRVRCWPRQMQPRHVAHHPAAVAGSVFLPAAHRAQQPPVPALPRRNREGYCRRPTTPSSRQKFPQDQATGYKAWAKPMGAWQLSLQRPGVAEFWTMKTRKKWREHKMPKLF